MVTELVSGIWAWELMAAVDQNDEAFLANARRAGIEPGVVARQLMSSGHRFVLEHSFFHADPHPANLLIPPNSQICFIDFGAVGRFASGTRSTWRELQYHLKNLHIEQMVASSVRPAERDLCRLGLCGQEHRCTMVGEEHLPELVQIRQRSQRFGMPVSLEILQFFRATLLYDSIIMRLDKDTDPVREFVVYAEGAGKSMRKGPPSEPGGKHGVFFERGRRAPATAITLASNSLPGVGLSLPLSFGGGRSAEPPLSKHQRENRLRRVLARLVRWVFILGGIGLAADYLARTFFGREIPWRAVLESLQSMGWFQIMVLSLTVVFVRRVLVRVSAPDQRADVETPLG